MKSDLLIQYGAIRETIIDNVKTIEKLVAQAQSLKDMVEKITENATKTSLEQEVKELENTISNLIEQTNALFDKYNQFVKAVFSK